MRAPARSPAARPRSLLRARQPGHRSATRAPSPSPPTTSTGSSRSPRARTPTSSSSAPRRRWSPGSSTRCTSAGVAAFGPTRGGRAARGLQGVRQGGHGAPPACRPPRGGPSTTVAEGMAAIERYPVVLKFDGLAAGKGVVIAADEAEARAALHEFLVAPALRPGPRRRRGAPRGRGAVAAGAVRRRDARCRWRPPRTTSASSTATRARTPAAWAPTRPCPGVDASTADAIARQRAPAVVDELRAPRHAVPRRALRRAHAHRGRPAGARVQRALRRSRDAGACCPACARTCSTCCCAAPRRAASTRSRFDGTSALGRDRRAGQRRLSGVGLDRRPDRRPRRRARRGRGHARGHGARRAWRHRHRRRPGPQRHRAGRDARRRPRRAPMLPPT